MPKRVLIVDDDESDRRILEEAAAALGYAVTTLKSNDALEDELLRMRFADLGEMSFDTMPATTEAMARAIELGRRAANSSMPVLIEGEKGSGKGLLARTIHAASSRGLKPFVAMRCAADAQDDPFFSSHAGSKLDEANGGTLFLDAVGALSPPAQKSLLAAIERGAIASKQGDGAGVRLIAATEQSLMRLVEEGRFREDLYYRLTVFPIRIPAAREHSGTERINGGEAATPVPPSPSRAPHLEGPIMLGNSRLPATIRLSGGSGRDTVGIPALGEEGEIRALNAVEADLIRLAFGRYRGRMTEIAKRLGIGRSTLYRKLRDIGLATRAS
jgi:DNA-binding NtrC family response regulator